MIRFGDPTSFAIGFELRPDPDLSGDPATRASWGAVEIWVAGRCLTRGIAADESLLQEVEIPLLPVLSWFIETWDVFLHEERIPFKTRGTFTSIEWYLEVVHDSRYDSNFLDLLEAREHWWKRHALGSAVPDFRIPDVHFRRYGQKIEISWSDVEWRGCGKGARMLEAPGAALFELDTVTSVLVQWCGALLAELETRGFEQECGRLRTLFTELGSGARQIARLRLAASEWIDRTADKIRAQAGVTDPNRENTIRSLLGVQSPSQGYYEILTVPVLLYRSADPKLSMSDVQQLLGICSEVAQGDAARLAEFQDPSGPPASPPEVTNDGYARALHFREAYGIPEDAPLTDAFDLETKILPSLDVQITDVLLEDRGTDGASVCSEKIPPTIAVNRNGRFSQTLWGRRMTLAHELCHLLHDVELGQTGIVSGPWAPSSLERRANAFAAMLLAPEKVLAATLPADVGSWVARDLSDAMARIGVGIRTLTWQLYNLDWISASERDAWVDELAR